MPLLWSLALTILAMVSADAQTSSSNCGPVRVIKGEVAYVGLDALPWGAVVHIYVEDGLANGARSGVSFEKKIVTEGEQIPIKFTLDIPCELIRSDHVYKICADISIRGRVVFPCDRPVLLPRRDGSAYVRLKLRRTP
jgi:uncharacterized lipoprotein YbaY